MKKLNYILFVLASAFSFLYSTTPQQAIAVSSNAFAVSPMSQRVSLVPGETYYGTFKITNPEKSESSFSYTLSINPVQVDKTDENYAYSFENNGDNNQIVDWITLDRTEGVIAPNSTDEVQFHIEVPENASAGGQYAAIAVRSKDVEAEAGGVNLQNRYQISHIIYAEVAGETVRKGEINDADISGFLFSGKITGTSTISNIGNVHSDATYTLQVFPLFSNEEIYTNEEEPLVKIILPDTTRTVTTSWDQTPSIGIFHVIYNVEFEGVNQKVDKMVIICPLWLLFIIAVIIFLIIFKILSGKKEKR